MLGAVTVKMVPVVLVPLDSRETFTFPAVSPFTARCPFLGPTKYIASTAGFRDLSDFVCDTSEVRHYFVDFLSGG